MPEPIVLTTAFDFNTPDKAGQVYVPSTTPMYDGGLLTITTTSAPDPVYSTVAFSSPSVAPASKSLLLDSGTNLARFEWEPAAHPGVKNVHGMSFIIQYKTPIAPPVSNGYYLEFTIAWSQTYPPEAIKPSGPQLDIIIDSWTINTSQQLQCDLKDTNGTYLGSSLSSPFVWDDPSDPGSIWLEISILPSGDYSIKQHKTGAVLFSGSFQPIDFSKPSSFTLDSTNGSKVYVQDVSFWMEGDPMPTPKITWGNPEEKFFETGVDKGVLYLNDGRAVAWNGLTSVDENGADSATAYYIDGRPFLYFPKPKEYAGTIKAFTYPDEFMAVMGMPEAADGMYLDSQIGDSFGLSYRTLVGNQTSGIDLGYKIHLIYNATISPQSISYDSISNSINPIEFSWQIQAVPLKVTGYRPTAHVIIDTRHMDPDRITEIENLLYGDGTTAAALPDPQTVFDILSFGDTIIVTDNGDGTWTAEGSYHNLYMIGDGIFEIDNINAVDNGDGTYTISDGGNTEVIPAP